MREQSINIIASQQCSRMARFMFITVSLMMALFLSACMPSSDESVNTELFKSKEDMAERTAKLKPGMKEADVFKTLGIAPERFEKMNAQSVQMTVYGNAQVQGSPAELEQFKNRIMSYEGYALPYRELQNSSSLGFGKMKVERTGHDLKLVLVFEKNRLLKAEIEGTQEVKQHQDQYLWDSLIRRGIGFAF